MATPDFKRKFFSEDEARRRMESWCAYQERSHLQVRRKLFQLGQNEDAADRILTRLITDGFLNEERFARAYAGGKFRMKKWGKGRIESQLRLQGVSPRCIATGIKEIDGQDYRKTLVSLLKKKMATVKSSDNRVRKHQAARFAIGKGYEPELVWQILGEDLTL